MVLCLRHEVPGVVQRSDGRLRHDWRGAGRRACRRPNLAPFGEEPSPHANCASGARVGIDVLGLRCRFVEPKPSSLLCAAELLL